MKRVTRKPRSSTSKAATYEEIGEYWDSHDLVSVGVADKPAEFEVDIKRRRFLVAIEPTLFAKVRRRAAELLTSEPCVGIGTMLTWAW